MKRIRRLRIKIFKINILEIYGKRFLENKNYVIIITNKSLGVFLWSLQNLFQRLNLLAKRKKSLYSQSKFKYAIRSMFAGAFLTFSTAAGAVGADLINKIAPGSGRFLFPFVFAWGLAYIVFFNAELVTSNMMFLTAGSFLKKNLLEKNN